MGEDKLKKIKKKMNRKRSCIKSHKRKRKYL